MSPNPSVRSFVVLSGCLLTSVMRVLNLFRYLDRVPDLIQSMISFKSPMVSEVEAGVAMEGVLEPVAFLAVKGTPCRS